MLNLTKGFFGRIFRLLLIVSLITGVIVLVIATIRQTMSMEESLVKENKLLAEVAAKSIEAGYLSDLWPFETLKKISDSEEILFLWIVRPNGEIFLADNPEMYGKVIDDPFLATQELKVRDNTYQDQRMKLIVHPLKIEVGKNPWSLFLGVSLKSIELAQRKTIFIGVGIFILVFLFTAFISFYFSQGVTRPLEKLREGAGIIGKGNLDYQIKVKTGDEIEELAESFNRMTEDLKRSQASLEESKTVLEIKVQARTKELRELAESLEEKVKERTKELQKKMEDLEKFQTLSIGRELKMVELKEEIKRLKEESEKTKGRK